MTYKFGDLIVNNPTFTILRGNVVGDFVTINARVNFGGSYLDWMIGAMPITEDMDTWAADQLEVYEVVVTQDENGNQVISKPQSIWQITKNWFSGLFS